MGFVVPFVNKDITQIRASFREWYYARMADEKTQKRMVLVVVSIALLLDNMLYMVIVPIIPDYLRKIGAWESKQVCTFKNHTGKDGKMYSNKTCETDYAEEEQLGFLFASKAMIQICVNPFSGTIIDRIGYEIPMMSGLIIMFFSTTIFALGQSYGVLFFARSLQGVGSAFADTSGLAMIADRFKEENERSKALGIALAFISFGCLVAPPFGGFVYQHAGKPFPFLLLALVCLMDGILVYLIIEPKIHRTEYGDAPKGTPIWRLFMDPYIACCSGALIMANVSLAFLEPTISTWMRDELGSSVSETGFIWLPAFFPHVAGVYCTIVLMRKYPQYPWLIAAIGLAMEGLSCFIVPFGTNFWVLCLPLAFICFGIALIDTSLLPMLGYLVDTRHVSVYGSVYAIADISYSLAYAFGPIIAGEVMKNQGFFALNVGICLSNLLFAPCLIILKKVYVYKPFEGDELQTFDGDSGIVAENGYQSKGYGALTPTRNGGYFQTGGNEFGDPTLPEQQGYGYGSNEYQGGFGVGKPAIGYQQDYPQPELQQDPTRRRPQPGSGYQGYQDFGQEDNLR